MCGITGAVWSRPEKALGADELAHMIAVLEHRGPDDSGTWWSRAAVETNRNAAQGTFAALGHRRLSIIDLSSGHQPLSNEDGSVWTVFNGEIYNYRELRSELQSRGHQFRTDTDTEVIVHLYEDFGADCVLHLRGMFAFAVWEQRNETLLLARDRMGQKPLYFRVEDGRLTFGSGLKSLLQVNNAPREIEPTAIDEFLTYQYVPHPRCILRGYRKLEPAHVAVYRGGSLETSRYWAPPYEDPQPTWSDHEWRDRLRQTMTEAVRLRMRSDVPLGAFLSGGVDSTLIAGLMQSLTDEPIHTFSIGFPIAEFDEREFALEASRFLGTRHHDAVVEPSAVDILPQLIWHYEEPFADSSAIPTMYLSRMTREHVTVALSGDGGDELFAGYDRYRAVRLGTSFDRLPRFARRALSGSLWQNLHASVAQKTFRRRLKRLLAALNDPPERRYLKWISIFEAAQRASLYTDEFQEQLGGFDAATFLLDAYSAYPSRDFVTRTTAADVSTYLPCDLLNKVDIASMSASLECRGPFMDHYVVELAARMPLRLKQSTRRGKLALLGAFGDLLPRSIQRRRKMGFGVPIDHWLRHDLKDLLCQTLLDSTSINRGFFRRQAIESLVEEHLSSRADHAYRLWALLCFELWCRTFVDASAVPLRAPRDL